MTTFAPTAPGSPPDLTGSKSSKSSSLHSSSLNSNPDGALTDISHFEDIGLDDDHRRLSHQDIYGYGIPKRPPPRTMKGGRGSTSTAVIMTTRDLTNGNNKRPGFPSLQGQVMGALSHNGTHSLSLPNGGGVKRGLSSPSTSSLGLKALTRNRSRSPSPSQSPACPISPRSMPNGTLLLRQDSSPVQRPPSRRGSWQPSRKTIKELEEEYHDSDEDLPDDASLWNVPMSPRPPQERTISATASANASASTSPERYPKSPLSSAVENGMCSIRPTASAPTSSHAQLSTFGSMPSSAFESRASQDLSMGPLPYMNTFAKCRAKSWTAAVSELSEEAKSLTEALEAHASTAEQQHETQVQSGTSPVTRPSLEKMQRARTSVVNLPPLRKNHVMIDPLPISKEKERVLSRTRPSWLPPKSQKEERKHLKEYQRMMAMAQENDQRRAARATELQCVRDDTKTSLLRIWEEHVLPNWDHTIRQPRTRELWWRGIATKSRGEVWHRAVCNDLALTEDSYRKALGRAKEVEKEINEGKTGREQEKQWFMAIRRDVGNTYPDLKIFQPDGPLNEGLTDVLMAYSMYRSDVGYSHGTHLIAALLLLSLPTPAITFLTLANTLNRPLSLAFIIHDPSAMQKSYTLTLNILAFKFPRLHHHLLETLQLHEAELFGYMFKTLFTCGLEIDLASR
ncbi:MAG: hypothetical protein M1830_003199, partial [Pleopsidium flavum]